MQCFCLQRLQGMYVIPLLHDYEEIECIVSDCIRLIIFIPYNMCIHSGYIRTLLDVNIGMYNMPRANDVVFVFN